MSQLRFTKDHEWVSLEGDVVTCGITDHAQGELGDIVFVELPEIGKTVAQGDEMAVVESVKAASEVYAPLSGTVVAVNEALSADPATVNKDAEGEGWFAKIRLSEPAQFEALMTREAYLASL